MRHNICRGAIIGLLTLGYSTAILAQELISPSPEPTVPVIIKKMGYRVAVETQPSKGAHHFRISWRSAKIEPGIFSWSALTSAPPTEQMQVLKRIDHKVSPPRQRSSEVSKDHMVVVVFDQQGTVRHWQTVTDPRLVRGEVPDNDGNLRNHSFYLTDVTLEMSVPDTIDAAEMHVLSPSWDSTGALQLEPVFAVMLPVNPQQ